MMRGFGIGLCILSFTAPCYGAGDGGVESVVNVSGKPISDAEALRLREDLRTLAKSLGAIAETEQKPSEPKKTVADVLDKALDLTGGFVSSVARSVQTAAPEVWRVLILQQYAEAIGNLVMPIGLLILTLIWLKVLKILWGDVKWSSLHEEEAFLNFVTRVLIPLIGGVVGGLWTVSTFSDSIKHLINPEYYAVKDLLTLIFQRERV